MGILSLFRKPYHFVSPTEEEKIVEAIRIAEKRTSGEIRVFMESRCRFVDPLDRAAELFYGLKMHETDQRNAVLIYIATKDHQLALFADEGIYQKCGTEFWKEEVRLMLQDFNKANYAEGLAHIVGDVGQALHQHFPYNNDTDKNELPDNIIFGK